MKRCWTRTRCCDSSTNARRIGSSTIHSARKVCGRTVSENMVWSFFWKNHLMARVQVMVSSRIVCVKLAVLLGRSTAQQQLLIVKTSQRNIRHFHAWCLMRLGLIKRGLLCADGETDLRLWKVRVSQRHSLSQTVSCEKKSQVVWKSACFLFPVTIISLFTLSWSCFFWN